MTVNVAYPHYSARLLTIVLEVSVSPHDLVPQLRDNGYAVRILYYLMYEGRPFERKNGSMSSRIASWDYFGNVIAISISYYKVLAGRIWSCLPFDRKIWLTSRPSIMVSYLKHQSTAELSLPLRFDFKKCVNICSASLEQRNC